MIDYERQRAIIAKGLKDYLGCPVVRSNQNQKMPDYPYVMYTVVTLASENNGTYSEFEDGIDRIEVTQTWSVTAIADNNSKCVELVAKAREWFARAGSLYFDDNDISVQSVGSIGNRDNVLTVEYEYRNGFDVVFWLYDEVENTTEESENYIESAEFNGNEIVTPPTTDELNEKLEKVLGGDL